MIFNRSLRVKSRDMESGTKMFHYLIKKLEQLLGTPNTYYAASLQFELVRTSQSGGYTTEALEFLDKGKKILDDHYGGPEKANYIDYYLKKIEM